MAEMDKTLGKVIDLVRLIEEKAVSNLVSRNQAPIVRHYDGYVILAQDEHDFQTKVSKIKRGDTFGFYTVERALSLNCA